MLIDSKDIFSVGTRTLSYSMRALIAQQVPEFSKLKDSKRKNDAAHFQENKTNAFVV